MSRRAAIIERCLQPVDQRGNTVRKVRPQILLFLAAALLAGCTSEQVYSKLQNDRALECQKYPDTRYEDCMAQLPGPYDEYRESLPETDRSPQQ